MAISKYLPLLKEFDLEVHIKPISADTFNRAFEVEILKDGSLVDGFRCPEADVEDDIIGVIEGWCDSEGRLARVRFNELVDA